MAAAKDKSRAKPKPKQQSAEDEFYGSPAEKGDNIDSRKWEYEEGDTLAGEVVGTFEGDGDFGPYVGYIVKPNPEYTTEAGGDNSAVSEDDPLVWYVNDNSAAKRSIPRVGIEVGDKIRVDYLGLATAKKSGREFKDFAVKVAKFEASAA